jgi:hypothetical protein
MTPHSRRAIAAVCISAILASWPGVASSASTFIGPLNISSVASTVPNRGDINPYGVSVVPTTAGRLVKGNVLVSNFNDRRNFQGTGRTIVEIDPNGHVALFANIGPDELPGPCPGGVGLTTALVSLSSGWVIVGSLPTKKGTSASMQAGCLLVLNRDGRVVEAFSGDPINGPWDMTALDQGSTATLFVTNVLNGTVAASPNVVNGGTIVRIVLSTTGSMPTITSEAVIGTGFAERTDPSALVVGPTGVGLAGDNTLYIADSVNSQVAKITDAVKRTSPVGGTPVSSGGAIKDPLGLAIAPNGDILTANGGDGNLVETAPSGAQLAVKTLDNTPAPPGPNGNGTLFGLATVPGGSGVYFVDDGSNTLNLLHQLAGSFPRLERHLQLKRW